MSEGITFYAAPEIIVTGQRDNAFLWQAQGPGGPDDPVNQVIAAQAYADGFNNVSADADVAPEIVVIARALKPLITSAFASLINSRNGDILVDCVGQVKISEILNILENIKFRVTNADFGRGRAGKIEVIPVTSSFEVTINANALKAYYDLYTGEFMPHRGLDYLLWHEIAHALVEGQLYNKQKFQIYSEGDGAGKTLDQRYTDYPDSQQFKDNEAWANTVARSLRRQFSAQVDPFGFVPTNGYSTVC